MPEPKQEISKEVKTTVIKDIFKRTLKQFINSVSVDEEIMLNIWEAVSGDRRDSFDDFCGLAAKIIYKRIYDLPVIIFPSLEDMEPPQELNQKWNVRDTNNTDEKKED